jgi:hypothetical protein
LIRAEQHLHQALANYSAGQLSAAWDDLDRAWAGLDQVPPTDDATVEAQVERLSVKASALQVKLLKVSDLPLQPPLTMAWRQSEAFADRIAAALCAGLAQEETTLSLTGDLIEIRKHVSYAESYQMVAQEPDRTLRELSQAKRYIFLARQNVLADDAMRSTLDSMSKELTALQARPMQSSPVVEARYRIIRLQVEDLLRQGWG